MAQKKTNAGPKRGVVISVADSHLECVPEVAQKCRDVGLDVEHVMNLTGTITGVMDASQVRKLQEIDGVSAVELERAFQIAPPDSDIQ